MCETLHRLYSDWEISPDVHAVLLKGAGGKAFCAGGDVKGMVQLLLAGQQDKAIRSAICLLTSPRRAASASETHSRPYMSLPDINVMICSRHIGVLGAGWHALHRSFNSQNEERLRGFLQLLSSGVHAESHAGHHAHAPHRPAGWHCHGGRGGDLRAWPVQDSNREVSYCAE